MAIEGIFMTYSQYRVFLYFMSARHVVATYISADTLPLDLHKFNKINQKSEHCFWSWRRKNETQIFTGRIALSSGVLLEII